MYKNHPAFESPNNKDAKVWRYMDFTKFVSLLEKKSLYFTRADKFDDPFEGSSTKATVEHNLYTIKEIFRQSGNEIDERLIEEYKEDNKNWPLFFFINCWHMNDFESAAMWKLYLNSNERISIQSNFDRLTKCFDKYTNYDIYIGMVKYVDFNGNIKFGHNLLKHYTYKRISFEHEKELRAVIFDPQDHRKLALNPNNLPLGRYVPIDLDILIENIYVSPTSSDWFYKLIKSITKKYEINKDVVKSNLSDDPVF